MGFRQDSYDFGLEAGRPRRLCLDAAAGDHVAVFVPADAEHAVPLGVGEDAHAPSLDLLSWLQLWLPVRGRVAHVIKVHTVHHLVSLVCEVRWGRWADRPRWEATLVASPHHPVSIRAVPGRYDVFDATASVFPAVVSVPLVSSVVGESAPSERSASITDVPSLAPAHHEVRAGPSAFRGGSEGKAAAARGGGEDAVCAGFHMLGDGACPARRYVIMALEPGACDRSLEAVTVEKADVFFHLQVCLLEPVEVRVGDVCTGARSVWGVWANERRVVFDEELVVHRLVFLAVPDFGLQSLLGFDDRVHCGAQARRYPWADEWGRFGSGSCLLLLALHVLLTPAPLAFYVVFRRLHGFDRLHCSSVDGALERAGGACYRKPSLHAGGRRSFLGADGGGDCRAYGAEPPDDEAVYEHLVWLSGLGWAAWWYLQPSLLHCLACRLCGLPDVRLLPSGGEVEARPVFFFALGASLGLLLLYVYTHLREGIADFLREFRRERGRFSRRPRGGCFAVVSVPWVFDGRRCLHLIDVFL